jgi:hypothetical protein
MWWLTKFQHQQNMMLSIDHTEVMTLLENHSNILDACILVQNKAAEKDLVGTAKATVRCMELIMQAIKSSNAVLHNVQERSV